MTWFCTVICASLAMADWTQAADSANTSEIVKVVSYAAPSTLSPGQSRSNASSGPVSTKIFAADTANADWKNQSGPFACTLTHVIAGFGSAVLTRKTGVGEVFYLSPQAPVVFPKGLATMETMPPVWRNDQMPLSLGHTTAVSGDQPVKLQANGFAPLLEQLVGGNKVMITSASYAGSSTPNSISTSAGVMRVVLDPKNFPTQYKNYQHCVSELIPYTFSQVSHLSFNYPEKSDGLALASKSELNKVAKYVKVDPGVLGVLVDAHSDNKGTPEENDAKSKQQSEWVNQYLVDQGVAAEIIKSRWHGDKFPVGNNSTDAGRAQNRRVTVRLENEATRRASEEKALARTASEKKLEPVAKVEIEPEKLPEAEAKAEVENPQQVVKNDSKVDKANLQKIMQKSSGLSSQEKITTEQISKMVDGLDLIPKH